MSINDSPTYIDLFAGAGGFSLGFSRAGFRCVGVVEKDEQASLSYAANFPSHLSSPLCLLGPEKGDILRLSKLDVERGLTSQNISDIDVLIAGPPCQGFSKVGRAKLDHLANENGAFKADPRNKLYHCVLDILDWTHPKMFLFENVPGILSLGGGNEAETFCKLATAKGYKVACTVLDAASYGVPQIRERVFILGIRSNLRIQPSFPAPLYCVKWRKPGGHLAALDLSKSLFTSQEYFLPIKNCTWGKPAVTVQQAIGDLPKFFDHLDRNYRMNRAKSLLQEYRRGRPSFFALEMRNWGGFESDEVEEHFCRCTPRDHQTFSQMRPGDTYPQAVELATKNYQTAEVRYRKGLLPKKPRRKDFIPPYPTDVFAEKWKKLIPGRPSWTVTAHLERDCYSHIHYDSDQQRTITLREAARLQSFPDGFEFEGNIGDCFRQIGNAVPPLLSFRLARHIRKLLKRVRTSGG